MIRFGYDEVRTFCLWSWVQIHQHFLPNLLIPAIFLLRRSFCWLAMNGCIKCCPFLSILLLLLLLPKGKLIFQVSQDRWSRVLAVDWSNQSKKCVLFELWKVNYMVGNSKETSAQCDYTISLNKAIHYSFPWTWRSVTRWFPMPWSGCKGPILFLAMLHFVVGYIHGSLDSYLQKNCKDLVISTPSSCLDTQQEILTTVNLHFSLGFTHSRKS